MTLAPKFIYPGGREAVPVPVRHDAPVTSHMAAESAAVGRTERQAAVIALLTDAGEAGLTCFQIEEAMGWSHQSTSGLLKPMQDGGYVAVQAGFTRANAGGRQCQVYVLPRSVSSDLTADPMPPAAEASVRGTSRERVYDAPDVIFLGHRLDDGILRWSPKRANPCDRAYVDRDRCLASNRCLLDSMQHVLEAGGYPANQIIAAARSEYRRRWEMRTATPGGQSE